MKSKMTCILAFILFLSIKSNMLMAQVMYGNNNYIEYHVGNSPFIISIPHGGASIPPEIPDRTCNGAVTGADLNTVELGKQIDSAFFQETGCHPHLIICNLARIKVDCNRNITDGACGDIIAEQAWNEYHHFIDTAQVLVLNNFINGFYVDLHGHAHSIDRLELGYLLSQDELSQNDSVLNSDSIVENSSIQQLVNNNLHGYSHAELLHGNYSIGTLFANAGYPAVPSAQDPFPAITDSYFTGGYDIANHTSFVPGNIINGVQMECYFNGIRDTYINRKSFADSLVNIYTTYLLWHQNLDLSNCSMSSGYDDIEHKDPFIHPTLLRSNEKIQLEGVDYKGLPYKIVNSSGWVVHLGEVTSFNEISCSKHLSTGIYCITIEKNEKYFPFKIMIIE